MTLPDIYQTVTDGGLGSVGTGGIKNSCLIGTCSGGTPNTLYSFNSIDDVRSTLVSGVVAERAAYTLQSYGGPVWVVPTEQTVSATTGAVSYERAGASGDTGYVTATGTASATQVVVLKVTNAAPETVASGNVMVSTSTDGGVTFGTAAALATTGILVVAGVTFKFSGLFFQNTQARLSLTTGAAVKTSPTISRATGITSTGTLAVSGNAANLYRVRIVVTSSGIVDTGSALRFKVSLDNGDTYGKEVTAPSSGAYLIPTTGLTVTLSGFLNAGDAVLFTTTAPGYTLADAQAAFAALELGSSEHFPIVHFTGSASSASASATFGAGCAAILEGAVNRHRFGRAFIDAADVANLDNVVAFQNVVSTRLSVGAGYADVVSALDGHSEYMNAQSINVATLSGIPLSTNSNWTGLPAKGVRRIYHNEYRTQGLDAARFVTLRTIVMAPGFYVTRSNMMAPVGSDYAQAPNCMVMDAMCSTTRRALLPYLNRTAAVDTETGFILQSEAVAIETAVLAALTSVLGSDVSGFTVEVNRTWNILSTNKLKIKIRCIPLALLEELTVDIGMTNPAVSG